MGRSSRPDTGEPFCTYCGYSPSGEWRERPHRVCTSCNLGVVLVSASEALPRPTDLFLIVDGSLTVKAVSRHAETVLLVQEHHCVELP
jgi:hypothetical protein